MNVSLTPELEELVHQKVQSGRYGSASEVIRAGLRMLLERDEEHEMKLRDLRQRIEVGIRDADVGRLVSGEEVFKRLRQKQVMPRRRK